MSFFFSGRTNSIHYLGVLFVNLVSAGGRQTETQCTVRETLELGGWAGAVPPYFPSFGDTATSPA